MSIDILGAALGHVQEFSSFGLAHAVLNQRGTDQRGARPGLVARNDSGPSNSNSTVSLFIDAYDPDSQWAASIVAACADRTVYLAQCTAGPPVRGEAVCGMDSNPVTITEGASVYEATDIEVTRTLGYDVTIQVRETCSLKGTTEADCKGTVALAAASSSTTTVASATLTGANYYRYEVQITAGAEKTANPTGTCSNSAGQAYNARDIAILGLLGAMGVSVFLLS